MVSGWKVRRGSLPTSNTHRQTHGEERVESRRRLKRVPVEPYIAYVACPTWRVRTWELTSQSLASFAAYGGGGSRFAVLNLPRCDARSELAGVRVYETERLIASQLRRRSTGKRQAHDQRASATIQHVLPGLKAKSSSLFEMCLPIQMSNSAKRGLAHSGQYTTEPHVR